MPLPDDLAARLAPRIEPVPDHDGAYVRTLTADVGLDFLLGELPPDEMLIRLVHRALCDAAGTRMFEDGDVAEVRALPVPFVYAAAQTAMALNGLLGEAAENPSSDDPDGCSPSGLP
jgi:hypothetical protein